MSDQRGAVTESAAHRRIRRTVLAVAIALTTIVFTGGVETAGQGWSVTPGVAAADPPASTAEPTSDNSTVEPPSRVRIPAIQVDSPLEDLTLDSAGALRAPVDYARAGWYAQGTAPGDVGPAVIAGHVDSHRGPAVFFRLYQLHADDLIQVQRGARWVIFRVEIGRASCRERV